MKCHNCGEDITEGSNFCSKCGAPAMKYCQQCKTLLSSGERFCPKCGCPAGEKKRSSIPEPVNPPPVQRIRKQPAERPAQIPGEMWDEPERPRKPKKKNIWLWVSLFLLLAVLAGVGSFCLNRFVFVPAEEQKTETKADGKDEKEEETTQKEAETQDQRNSVSASTVAQTSDAMAETTVKDQRTSETVTTAGDSSVVASSGVWKMGTDATSGAASQEAAAASVSANGDYILPDSATKYLNENDLAGLTKDQLRLARNEIYARHGRSFKTEDLNSYFGSKSWYHGSIGADDFNEDILNPIEKANLELIKAVEEKMN